MLIDLEANTRKEKTNNSKVYLFSNFPELIRVSAFGQKLVFFYFLLHNASRRNIHVVFANQPEIKLTEVLGMIEDNLRPVI